MRRLHLALMLLALLAGCDYPTGPEFLRIEDLHVAAHPADCVGLVPMTCLQVRRHHPSAAWTNLYEPIEGFTHEPGFEYELRVAVFRVRNPPADGSSRSYKLLRVLRRVAVLT